MILPWNRMAQTVLQNSLKLEVESISFLYLFPTVQFLPIIASLSYQPYAWFYRIKINNWLIYGPFFLSLKILTSKQLHYPTPYILLCLSGKSIAHQMYSMALEFLPRSFDLTAMAWSLIWEQPVKIKHKTLFMHSYGYLGESSRNSILTQFLIFLPNFDDFNFLFQFFLFRKMLMKIDCYKTIFFPVVSFLHPYFRKDFIFYTFW